MPDAPASPARATMGGEKADEEASETTQGAGTFNERIHDAATTLAAVANPRTELFVLGDRGRMVARQRGLSVAWSAPMIAHVDEAVSLAHRIVEALDDGLGPIARDEKASTMSSRVSSGYRVMDSEVSADAGRAAYETQHRRTLKTMSGRTLS